MTVTAIIYLILNQIKPTLLDHQGKNEIQRYSGERLHS